MVFGLDRRKEREVGNENSSSSSSTATSATESPLTQQTRRLNRSSRFGNDQTSLTLASSEQDVHEERGQYQRSKTRRNRTAHATLVDGDILGIFSQFNQLASIHVSENDIANLERAVERLREIIEICDDTNDSIVEIERTSLSEAPQRNDSEPSLPRDEYNTIDEEIPPYNVTLHKYLDRISFDPRFSPVLRVNRRLVRTPKELKTSIEDLKSFNILPDLIDPWAISHVDDCEFEDMIPHLIQEESRHHANELQDGSIDETLDRVIAISLLESDFYQTVPSQPPRYRRKHRR